MVLRKQGCVLVFVFLIVVAFIEYLLEMKKARQGVWSATKSGNGLQKTSNIVLSGLFTIFTFFFDFSVAFVVREENPLKIKDF